MRILSFFIVALLAVTAGAVTSSAQKGKGKKGTQQDEKAKEPKTVTDVGGKSLEELIEEISSTDRSKGVAALKSVVLFGAERARAAVPAILKMLEKHTKYRQTIDPSFLVNAPTTLTMILTNQKEPATENGKKRLIAEVKETVTVLKKLVHDSQVVVRHRAAQALTMFGPYATEAIPDLMRALLPFENPSFEARQAVVVALASVARPAKGKEPDAKVVAALYSRLKDPASPVRSSAINALQALGVPKVHSQQTKFETAVGAVARNKEEEPLLRIQAHLALYELTTKAKKQDRIAAIARFLDPSKYKENAVRLQAAQALGMIGKDALDQVPALGEAITDKDGAVGAMAIHSIANIGREDAGTKAKLVKLIADPARPLPVRLEVLKALGSLGPAAADVLSQLRAATADKEEAIVVTAIYAVASVGRQLAPAKKFLGQLILKESKPEVRLEAIKATAGIGEDGADIIPALLTAAKNDKEDTVKVAAIAAITQMGMQAKDAIPNLQLIVANASEPDAVRDAAREAIKLIQNIKPKSSPKKGASK